jgi:hypothetical protein
VKHVKRKKLSQQKNVQMTAQEMVCVKRVCVDANQHLLEIIAPLHAIPSVKSTDFAFVVCAPVIKVSMARIAPRSDAAVSSKKQQQSALIKETVMLQMVLALVTKGSEALTAL